MICDARGQIVQSWGDADALIYPRSSAKMIQALPLLTTGAADKYGLGSEHLALACASHNGAAIHTTRVRAWLDRLELTDAALRCGPQMPNDRPASEAMIRAHGAPCQYHNNCSGKHCGFLSVARHMAPPGAQTMAMIGNGAQSEFQILAFKAICGLKSVRLYDIDTSATA